MTIDRDADRDPDRAEVMAGMFRLLGDPTRLRILLACLHEARPVGAIAEAVGVSGSLVSHHLRLLRAARLVSGTRAARQVFYTAADDHVRDVVDTLMRHADEEEPGGYSA